MILSVSIFQLVLRGTRTVKPYFSFGRNLQCSQLPKVRSIRNTLAQIRNQSAVGFFGDRLQFADPHLIRKPRSQAAYCGVKETSWHTERKRLISVLLARSPSERTKNSGLPTTDIAPRLPTRPGASNGSRPPTTVNWHDVYIVLLTPSMSASGWAIVVTIGWA